MKKEDKMSVSYVVDNKSINIGHIPGRKQLCLYSVDGSTLSPLAYFSSEMEAGVAAKWMDTLVKGTLAVNGVQVEK